MQRFVGLLATVGLLAGVLIAAQPAASAGPYLLVNGNNLTYNAQTVTLRGENFNNEPALSYCCGGTSITQINVNEADYTKASSLNENHIRFGLDWAWYNTNQTQFFSVLDQHVAWAGAHNLWMIPVMFIPPGGSNGGYGGQGGFWGSSSNMTALTNFWSAFATHFANNNTIAGYDIFNEPAPNSVAQYDSWAQSTYNAITAADPNHFVAIEESSANWDLPSVTGTRILWSSHCYATVGTNGCNFPGPNPSAPSKLPFWVGEIGSSPMSGGVQYVPGNLSNYNGQGVSWAHFVMHETGYGLYQNWGAGDFSSPWQAMIDAVTSAAAGAIKPGSPPSNDFSISANPASLTVVQGNSGTSTISTALVSGTAETITLSASGQPSGVTTTFNPTSVTTGGSSTLTLAVATSTATGTYPITVTGTAPSATHNTTVSLTVTAPPPPGAITVTQQSIATVVRPASLTMSGTLKNTGASSITLQAVVVAGRAPGGTNSGGPYYDFATVGSTTIAVGASYTLTGTRSFLTTDPAGNWRSYITYQTADNVWHDGTDTVFIVR